MWTYIQISAHWLCHREFHHPLEGSVPGLTDVSIAECLRFCDSLEECGGVVYWHDDSGNSATQKGVCNPKIKITNGNLYISPGATTFERAGN